MGEKRGIFLGGKPVLIIYNACKVVYFSTVIMEHINQSECKVVRGKQCRVQVWGIDTTIISPV